MFDLIAKKLTKDEDLVKAVEALRGGNRREKNQAFMDLRDTYNNIILKIYGKVSKIGRDSGEKEEIKSHLEAVFIEALMSDKLQKYDNLNQVGGYLRSSLENRAHPKDIEELLGHVKLKGLSYMKGALRRAIKDFRKKHNRMPDLRSNSSDFEDIAEMMNVEESVLDQVIKAMDIKSLFQEMSEDKGGGAATLMDKLKSQDPLPDEVYKNKELIRILLQEAKRRLKPEEYRVFMEMYHLDNPAKKDKTQKEVADELEGIDERQVKYILKKIPEKLKSSPKIKEMISASEKREMIRYANSKYKYINKVSSKDYERIVFDVIKNK